MCKQIFVRKLKFSENRSLMDILRKVVRTKDSPSSGSKKWGTMITNSIKEYDFNFGIILRFISFDKMTSKICV